LGERRQDWSAWRQVKQGVAERARPLAGEKGLCRVDLDGFEEEHVGIEPRAGVTRHQPHSKKIAELQNSPVAPCPVRLRRAQFFSERMRQDRFRFGVADAVGQARERLKTVDGDFVARSYLRSQAGQAKLIEAAMPEGGDG